MSHIVGKHNFAGTVDLFINDIKIDAYKSLSFYNHSPDGFSMGYNGSGPTQMALAILLEFATTKNIVSQFTADFRQEFLSDKKYQKEDLDIHLDVKAWILTKINSRED